jgi:hypothetical protein
VWGIGNELKTIYSCGIDETHAWGEIINEKHGFLLKTFEWNSCPHL